MKHRVFTGRISTGVERLDTMLDGGYLRGTCTLVSGAPGTSKTSIAGAFAEAACERGERTLFVSFEESGEAIVRNLASVDIRLGRFVRSGLLRIYSVPISGQTPEAHTLRIARIGSAACGALSRHRPCLGALERRRQRVRDRRAPGPPRRGETRGHHRSLDRVPLRRLRSDARRAARFPCRRSPTPGCTSPTWLPPASAIAP